MLNLLWLIVVALVVLWILGLVLRIGGRFIHLLIVVALIVGVFFLIFRI
jgi:Family of unknown function (DUF5670)